MNPDSDRILEQCRNLVSTKLGPDWFVDMSNDKRLFKLDPKTSKEGDAVFGVCISSRKEIFLHLDIVKKYPFDDVWEEVTRHEIAHGKAGCKHGHNLYWKLWAIFLKCHPSPYLNGSKSYIKILRKSILDQMWRVPERPEPSVGFSHTI